MHTIKHRSEIIKEKIFNSKSQVYYADTFNGEVIKNNIKNDFEIPDIKIIKKLIKYFDTLNYFSKLPYFPISKNCFYRIKNYLLTYLVCIDHPDIKWTINPTIEHQTNKDGSNIYMIYINFEIDNKIWGFHQKLDKTFLCRYLYKYIKNFPIIEYIPKSSNFIKDKSNILPSSDSIIKLWKDTFKLIEENNWFICYYLSTLSWIDSMNSIYPELKLKVFGKSFISKNRQLKNHYKIKNELTYTKRTQIYCENRKKSSHSIDEWKNNFSKYLSQYELHGTYNLKLKENNI